MSRKVFWILALVASGCGGGPSHPSGILQCSATPTSGFAPLTVTFSVQVATPSYTLEISYGDGTSGSNPNAAHVYVNPGTYTAGVQESVGGAAVSSCSQTITVVPFHAAPPPEGPPFVRFHVTPDPPTGPAPLTVKFNMCNSHDPDGDPLSYTYSFGDGSSASGPCRLDHVYEAKGRQFAAEMCISDTHHEACKNVVVQTQ